MPNQVHGVLLPAMSGTELSHVRTELERRRIRTSIPPHPVQANPQLPPHRYLGNALVSAHRQVHARFLLVDAAQAAARCNPQWRRR